MGGVEERDAQLTKDPYLDKLIGEQAKDKVMEKILRIEQICEFAPE